MKYYLMQIMQLALRNLYVLLQRQCRTLWKHLTKRPNSHYRQPI